MEGSGEVVCQIFFYNLYKWKLTVLFIDFIPSVFICLIYK